MSTDQFLADLLAKAEAATADTSEIERVARAFHNAYETFAHRHNWQTQEASRVNWSDLPPANKLTMLSTVGNLLEHGVIADPTTTKALVSALVRVRELHVRAENEPRLCDVCQYDDWPCPTIRITDALGSLAEGGES